MAGIRFLLQELLEKKDTDINDAVWGAAIGGHKILLQELLENKDAHINWAVRGAACGGHKILLQEFLKKGADIKYAVTGAAQGGHKILLRELLEKKGADINWAMQAANKDCAQYLAKNCFVLLSNKVAADNKRNFFKKALLW